MRQLAIHHDIIDTSIIYDENKIEKLLDSDKYDYATINNQIIFYCHKNGYNSSSDLVRLIQYKFSCDKKLYYLTSADPIDVKEFYSHSAFGSHFRFNSPFCKFNKDFIEYLFTCDFYHEPYLGFTINFQTNSINIISLPKNTVLSDTFCYSSEYVYIIDFMYGNHIKLPMLPFSQIKESRDKYEKLSSSYTLKWSKHLCNLNDSYLAGVLWWDKKHDYIFDIYQIDNKNVNLIYTFHMVSHYELMRPTCIAIGNKLVVSLRVYEQGYFFIFNIEEDNKLALLNNDYIIFGMPFLSKWQDILIIRDNHNKYKEYKMHVIYNNKIFDDTILKRIKYSIPENGIVVW